MEHPRDDDVAGELRLAAELLGRVARGADWPTCGAASRQRSTDGHAAHAGELADRVEDAAVAGAAAEVPVQAALDLVRARQLARRRAARPVSSIPGVQKPHWSAAWRVNASSSARELRPLGEALDR